MNGKKRKLSAAKIVSLVFGCFAVLAAAALLITNAFIPVRYLYAYVFCGSSPLAENSADVTFIDTGYGSSAIVRFSDGKVLLVDGGDTGYGNNLKLITALNRLGVDDVDWLVCTSVKSEHCGGLSEVIKYKRVSEIFLPYCKNTYITDEYRSFYLAARDSGSDLITADYGVGESGDDYFFVFLSPTAHTADFGEYAAMNVSPTNDNIAAASAVLWVECGGVSLLFSSDATDVVFEKIVREYSVISSAGDRYAIAGENSVELERLDIIAVSSHGASAYAPFYDLAKPRTAVVSVGSNYFGAPSVSAMSTVCNTAEAYTTDECGNITVVVKDGKYTLSKEKS